MSRIRLTDTALTTPLLRPIPPSGGHLTQILVGRWCLDVLVRSPSSLRRRDFLVAAPSSGCSLADLLSSGSHAPSMSVPCAGPNKSPPPAQPQTPLCNRRPAHRDTRRQGDTAYRFLLPLDTRWHESEMQASANLDVCAGSRALVVCDPIWM